MIWCIAVVHLGVRVLLEMGVKDGVRHLVAHLVWGRKKGEVEWKLDILKFNPSGSYWTTLHISSIFLGFGRQMG